MFARIRHHEPSVEQVRILPAIVHQVEDQGGKVLEGANADNQNVEAAGDGQAQGAIQ